MMLRMVQGGMDFLQGCG